MSDPTELALERLNRLEHGQRGTNERLDRIEASLGRMVAVLEAHDQRLEQVVDRLDRLIELTMRARTEDTSRMADIERRLDALEERNTRPT